MQNSISSGRIDPSNIRVQFAARLIVFHCNRGRKEFWVKPLIDQPVFDYYFGSRYSELVSWRELGNWALSIWPEKEIDHFKLFPILQLLRRHTMEEQKKIINLLEETYGLRRFK